MSITTVDDQGRKRTFQSEKALYDFKRAEAAGRDLAAGIQPWQAPPVPAATAQSQQTRKEVTQMSTRKNQTEASDSQQSAVNAFHLLVAAERQRCPRLTRHEAIARVAKKEPGLHKLYLQATNPGKKL